MLNHHQIRWLEFLKDYEIYLYCYPSKDNIEVDAFSIKSIDSVAHVEEE